MNSNDSSNEDTIDKFEIDEMTPSVDDFIKELEEKEKNLDISSDMVIEVADSEVEHNNIHESFISVNDSEPKSYGSSSSSNKNQPTNKESISKLQEKVVKLAAERDELKESMGRRQRDFDNYRKRMERERHETFKNLLGNLATQILPVLDNLNRALDSTEDTKEKSSPKDMRTFYDGIVLVNQQLNDVLMEMGVQQIASVGEPFDPTVHEAVATEETDEYPNKTVVQELLRGYRIDDRIIRASMVKVSSSHNKKSSETAKLD